MKTTAAIIVSLALGLAAPLFLFGLIILGLSLVDVAGQVAGVGTE